MLGERVVYQGKRYGSLSEVGRVITGSRRSGPLFFGLRKQAWEAMAENHEFMDRGIQGRASGSDAGRRDVRRVPVDEWAATGLTRREVLSILSA